MSNQGGQSNRWDVMSIREYTDRAGVQKTNWTKIGVAFTNKNGSINVQLDAFPIDGKLQLQVPLTPEEKERLGFGQGRQQQGGGQQQQGGQRQQQGQGNPRNAGQQQRNANAQRYGSRGASQPQQQSFGPPPPPQQVPHYQQDEYHPGGPDGQEAGWEVNGVWITDARQLPKDHPDFIPF
jgi:hypothetical protein